MVPGSTRSHATHKKMSWQPRFVPCHEGWSVVEPTQQGSSVPLRTRHSTCAADSNIPRATLARPVPDGHHITSRHCLLARPNHMICKLPCSSVRCRYSTTSFSARRRSGCRITTLGVRPGGRPHPAPPRAAGACPANHAVLKRRARPVGRPPAPYRVRCHKAHIHRVHTHMHIYTKNTCSPPANHNGPRIHTHHDPGRFTSCCAVFLQSPHSSCRQSACCARHACVVFLFHVRGPHIWDATCSKDPRGIFDDSEYVVRPCTQQG